MKEGFVFSILFTNRYESRSDTAEGAEASVDGQDNARDEGGGVAAQELCGAVELRQVTEAAHRSLGDHLYRPVGEAAVGIKQGGTVLLADEESRRQGIDTYLLSLLDGHLLGQPAREIGHTFLGRAIAGYTRKGIIGSH